MSRFKGWGLAAVVATATFGFATGAQSIELKINGLHAPDHAMSMTHDFFADRVEQLTNGEITLDVHHARGLGDAVESVQSVRNGSIAFFSVSAANLSQVDPRIDMFSLPFIFRNGRHYWWYLTSERGREFVKPLEERGIVVLGYMDSGARSFFGRDNLSDPAALAGKKIRTMASPVQIAMMDAMGGTGVPLAWGELYNALQTGVVDGAENNPPSVRSMRFYEVTSSLVLNEHARIPDMLIASKRVMDQLTPEQQAAIRQAGLEAEAFMRGAWAADEQASLAFLRSLPDFEVVTDVDKTPFIEAVRDLLDTEGARLGVADEVEYLLESGERF
jgi:tripartite ATP-independent transporter DctP family solute receptor